MKFTTFLAPLLAALLLDKSPITFVTASELSKKDICSLTVVDMEEEISPAEIRTALAFGSKFNNNPIAMVGEIDMLCSDVVKSSSFHRENMQRVTKFSAGFGGLSNQQKMKLEDRLLAVYMGDLQDKFQKIFGLAHELHTPEMIAYQLNAQDDACLDDDACMLPQGSAVLRVMKEESTRAMLEQNFLNSASKKAPRF